MYIDQSAKRSIPTAKSEARLRTRSVCLRAAAWAFAAILCRPAIADDPCESTNVHAAGLAEAFQRAGGRKLAKGVFHVEQIGAYGEGATGRPHFVVEYGTSDNVIFRQRIPHPSADLSDVFTLKPLQVDGGASLGIKYQSGAGGAIACTYVIRVTDGRFVARRGPWPLSQRDRLISELVKAADRGDLKAVTSAIRAGADVNGKLPEVETGALYFAAQNGHLAVVKVLLDNGARVDGTGGDDFTPLMAAVNAEHTNIVKELLQRGADPHIQASSGSNAISLAEGSGRADLVKLLKAGKNTPVATSASDLPPLPFLDFSRQVDVIEGRWTLRKAHKLLGGISPEPIVIDTLPPGSKVDAKKIGMLTLSYTVYKVKIPTDYEIWNWNYKTSKYDNRHVSLKKGENITVLSYFGEGECRIWLRGAAHIAFCPEESADGPFVSDPAYPDLRTEIWAVVITSDGRRGYLRNPDAAGMSKHD